jgi:hypothetical protein
MVKDFYLARLYSMCNRTCRQCYVYEPPSEWSDLTFVSFEDHMNEQSRLTVVRTRHQSMMQGSHDGRAERLYSEV